MGIVRLCCVSSLPNAVHKELELKRCIDANAS